MPIRSIRCGHSSIEVRVGLLRLDLDRPMPETRDECTLPAPSPSRNFTILRIRARHRSPAQRQRASLWGSRPSFPHRQAARPPGRRRTRRACFRLPPMRSLICSALLAACLGGCTTSSSSLVLHAGDVASATADGDRALLTVRNQGPGNVVVVVEDEAGTTELGTNGSVRYAASGGRVATRVTATGRAIVEFEARRATGFAFEHPHQPDYAASTSTRSRSPGRPGSRPQSWPPLLPSSRRAPAR